MAYVIPLILTQGIYTGVITTISKITINSALLIKSIYNHENPDIIKIINELDLDQRFKIIQSVLYKLDLTTNNITLTNLDKTQIFNIIDEELNENDPIELCLKYIHENINQIHHNLVLINRKIDNHKKKWFNKWRTLNIEPYIQNIKNNSNKLNLRFDDLLKISSLLHNY